MAPTMHDFGPASSYVEGGTPVTLWLADAGGVVLEDVEVVIDGVSCTTSAGTLLASSTATISGGAVVEDLTDVRLETAARWYSGPGEVAWSVVYDGSPVASGTLQVVGRGPWCGCRGAWRAAEPTLWPSAIGQYLVSGPATYGAPIGTLLVASIHPGSADVDLVVREPWALWQDGTYLVGRVVIDDTPASGVVAMLHIDDTPASGVVLGDVIDDTPASAVVQGPVIDDTPASGIVGRSVIDDTPASGIVAQLVIEDMVAAGVVYGVRSGTVVEVHVTDPSTLAALAAMGITWS